MSTYLKNMAGYKHNQLKNKSFDDIQKLFDKAMKRVNTFVDIDTELVEGSEVRAEAEIAQESSSKRAGTELEQESIKKQKVDEDKEIAELQRLIEVVPDKEEVAIDAIPLATKPPSIVDWKIHRKGKKSYYQIIRADGSSKMCMAVYVVRMTSELRLQDVRIKRLHDDLEVTAAKVCVTAAKYMDQDSVHMVAASKVPMLKPGEYELWRMRMEQYIQMIDYSLWEVIENGNAPPITKVVKGVETIIAPTTAKEKAQRRLKLKARSTLLMGNP
ncbi:hypothetical protein Tco_1136426 [Tanacetum coccineum]